MPLFKGKGNIGKNIAELHQGKTYAKTAAKHGKDTANKQAVAIAYKEAGKSTSDEGDPPKKKVGYKKSASKKVGYKPYTQDAGPETNTTETEP